jgi:hypothetical protein
MRGVSGPEEYSKQSQIKRADDLSKIPFFDDFVVR